MNLIREGNRGLGNDDPYWIGGTTTQLDDATVPYSQYFLTGVPGKKCNASLKIYETEQQMKTQNKEKHKEKNTSFDYATQGYQSPGFFSRACLQKQSDLSCHYGMGLCLLDRK